MKRRTAIVIFTILCVMVVAAALFAYSYYLYVYEQKSYELNDTLVVANWNLQVFGDGKANDSQKMEFITSELEGLDIIFLQEIRDKDASSLFELCGMMQGYDCIISSRAGRSSSKEQYGVIYRKGLDVAMTDYNTDNLDRNSWERPPISLQLDLVNYSIVLYNIHTKPDNATQELFDLDRMIEEHGDDTNIVVLGDLNADCNYFDEASQRPFADGWSWIVKDSDDTTSTKSSCAYDRIIANDDALEEVVQYGIRSHPDVILSDHYMVWVRLRRYDFNPDYTLRGYSAWLI